MPIIARFRLRAKRKLAKTAHRKLVSMGNAITQGSRLQRLKIQPLVERLRFR
jgi:hypothetical protein